MLTTAASAPLAAGVTDPIQFLLNDLDLSALTGRIQDTYSTLEVDVDVLVLEYRRFLVLKWVHRDEHAKLLSPSPLVDQVWHEHILDTASYIPMCQAIGLWIHHNPNGDSANDAAGRRRRRENTVELYTARFGPMDQTVWDMSGMRPALNAPMHQLATGIWMVGDGGTIVKVEDGTAELGAKEQRPSEVITLQFRDWMGQDLHLQVCKSTHFKSVAHGYAKMLGLDADDLKFVFDGIRIHHDCCETVDEVDLQDGDTIDVDRDQKRCFVLD